MFGSGHYDARRDCWRGKRGRGSGAAKRVRGAVPGWGEVVRWMCERVYVAGRRAGCQWSGSRTIVLHGVQPHCQSGGFSGLGWVAVGARLSRCSTAVMGETT